ncbi:polysaccharide deacetylase family protein, partial [Lysinibacillus sp. NPDC056232]|uniref:polysaccharide deacetylase family protein n=1 Tax=Lysinibacillus sp. NPDC056232 TaxID=3345756 RepID=UPI0035DC7CB5
NKYGSLIKFINSFYISKNELLEMKDSGMELGVHCVNHFPYKGPADVFFKQEISPCIDYFKNQLGFTPYYYTPAFGGGINYREMLIELEPILKDNGFKRGFTTIGTKFNANKDTFWINRIDCNQVEKLLL